MCSRLAATIDPHKATPSPVFSAAAEPTHTTHYSVVDGSGNETDRSTIDIWYDKGSVTNVAGMGLLVGGMYLLGRTT